jgi:cytochrome bd-type quinol oxidase subunit 1
MVIYALLMGVDIYLLAKYARKGVEAEAEAEAPPEETSSTLAMVS